MKQVLNDTTGSTSNYRPCRGQRIKDVGKILYKDKQHYFYYKIINNKLSTENWLI